VISESETYRLNMLRKAQERYDQKQKEALNASIEAAKASAEITRCSQPLPSDDLCPGCWFHLGVRSIIYPVPSREPDKFDAWKCRECGAIQERPA
jgi:hypothetical protein